VQQRSYKTTRESVIPPRGTDQSMVREGGTKCGVEIQIGYTQGNGFLEQRMWVALFDLIYGGGKALGREIDESI